MKTHASQAVARRRKATRRLPSLRFVLVTLLATLVSACNVDVDSTVYLRDIQEAADGSLTAGVTLTTYAPGAADPESCAKMEEFVPVLARYLGEAALEQCVKRDGAMEDAVVFSGSLPIVTEAEAAADSVLSLLVTAGDGEAPSQRLTLLAQPELVRDLIERVRQVNMMAAIDLTDVTVAARVINDLRESAAMTVRHAFVDGTPAVEGLQVELAPRDEVRLQLSDVKSLFLLTQGRGEVAEFALNR